MSALDCKLCVNKKHLILLFKRSHPFLSFIRLKTYTGRLFIKGRLLSISIMLLPCLGVEGVASWDPVVH